MYKRPFTINDAISVMSEKQSTGSMEAVLKGLNHTNQW